MEAEERDRAAQLRETIDLLIHAMRLHHRVVEKRIDGLGVHHSQHRMLMKLSGMGRSASQKDIAAAMDVSPACVARTLKQLRSAGLVSKEDGADSRRNEIGLLPQGQKLVDDSRAVFRQIDAEMFGGITGDELAVVNDVLRRMQANLTLMEKE